MIQSLNIENFRALKRVSVEELGRVNIIVGSNASGKTSLLEALYLVMGNSPENSLKLKRWRGLIEPTPFVAIDTGFHIWEDLFFDSHSPALSVEINDSIKGRRKLEVALSSDQSITLPFGEALDPGNISTSISFIWHIGGERFEGKVELTKEGLKLGRVPPFLNSAFMASHAGGPNENADRFSSLSKQNQQHDIVRSLSVMYPFIEDLSVETEIGGGVGIYAAIRSQEKKIPLPLVSEGINKYLSFLLAVCYAKGGVVLIDEMEGGFYYQTLEKIWVGLLDLASTFKTQIFVATHSMEALSALKPSIDKDVDSFALLRMKRDDKTGVCGVDRVSGKRIAAALEERFEIR